MDSFGVVELASQRRAVAPGWAYVPDSRNNALLPPGFGGAAAGGGGGGGGGGIGVGGMHQLDGSGVAGGGGGSATDNKPRKRAARSQAAGAAGNSLALFSDLTSRQETKLRKELEILGRDLGAPAGGGGAAARDAAIPIPQRALKAQNKYTPNVRKILASQKTFANHLDDFNAFNALHQTTQGHLNHGIVNETTAAAKAAAAAAAANNSPATANGATTSTNSSSHSRRHSRKDVKNDKTEPEASSRNSNNSKNTRSSRSQRSAASRRSTAAAAAPVPEPEPTPVPAVPDTPMPDAAEDNDKKTKTKAEPAPILAPYDGSNKPPPHPRDNDPLLVSAMPPMPSDAELRALVAGPPLPYPEARATLGGGSSGNGPDYPARVFCEICGYWGRVKCTKCGTPVCALDCLELHRQECITRYGL